MSNRNDSISKEVAGNWGSVAGFRGSAWNTAPGHNPSAAGAAASLSVGDVASGGQGQSEATP